MFSSFMNPVAIYVGYFSHLAFVVVLPDGNNGNNLQKKMSFFILQIKFFFRTNRFQFSKFSNPLSSRIFFFFSTETNERVRSPNCCLVEWVSWKLEKLFWFWIVLGRIAAVF